MENRKKFMDEVAVKLDIKKPGDWGKVTLPTVYKLGAYSLINNYYDGSLFHCLQSIYPGFCSSHL